MLKPKVLFLLKRRHDYHVEKHSNKGLSTGLFNSASFMVDMLNECGIESIMEVVLDNNCIDREVSKHRPTHVVIEALWVVPTKFSVLCKLHPNVKWVVRLHSETPFLANEGMAFDWLGDYARFKNLTIAVNAPRILNELRDYLGDEFMWSEEKRKNKVTYLPNYYPQHFITKKFDKSKDYIDVSCFGAIRPLKNHVIQAFAAIKFADIIGKKLRFHINSGRVEQKGDSILNNLKGIFGHLSKHELINHEWAPREEFVKTCGKMDIGMQVSFSETFNIVGADMISQGVPLVGSPEIPWMSNLFCAEATESKMICNKLLFTYYFPKLNVLINQYLLKIYTNKTKKLWADHFKNR